MKRSLAIGWGALALLASAFSAHAAPQLCVYEGNGADGRAALPSFEAEIGRKADCITDFVNQGSWSGFDSDATWLLGAWKGSGYRLMLSVPLTVNGTSLADIAAGKQDAHYAQLAKQLVADGFASAWVRLGWEFNGGWYPWAAFSNGGSPAAYIAAYQHVVSVMRATAGQSFRFVWCPVLGQQQGAPSSAYPGDTFVGVVGVDDYNQTYAAGVGSANVAVEPARWNSVSGETWGIAQIIAFAGQHHKPYAFPEWGTGSRTDGQGGGDDPLYVANMAGLIAKSEFAGYWDYNAADYATKQSDTSHPKAAAAYIDAFGASGLKGRVAMQGKGPYTDRCPTLTLTDTTTGAVGAHAICRENGPNHFVYIIFSQGPHPLKVTWTGKNTAANLYKPSAGSAAVQGIGTANSVSYQAVGGPNDTHVLALQF